MSPNQPFNNITFFDTEVGIDDKKVHDIGAINGKGEFHSHSISDFEQFISGSEYICGHNIINHDLKYLPDIQSKYKLIDTLPLSPLLFPQKPYHKLLKDDKLQTDELNNPLNDSKKARDLFFDEVGAFKNLDYAKKLIYSSLLYNIKNGEGLYLYRDFFDYVGAAEVSTNLAELIRDEFDGKICANANIQLIINNYPVELAYALALISTNVAEHSITPPWLVKNYPKIENVVKFLCGTPCQQGCIYCNSLLNKYKGLKSIFGYDVFRKFDGEPMQENAVQAALDGKSLLAIFPTGGGKSLTFQLPAMMVGRLVHGLTVVISPLQSLMKDQVDNLSERGYTDAVTINGLLDPVSRADAITRVADGSATMLYISPEMLRSKTIEKLLLSRNVIRFVIDEAHCFSAWGHDFRVDYLYIGKFIRNLQDKKQQKYAIPVSCFTATAKQKVISDICDYFKKELNIDLERFASTSARENLQYSVLHCETENQKYDTLRNLLSANNVPTIVYVSRTRRTEELAKHLSKDGFPTLPFNGKMESNDKIINQNAFINNEVRAIVATSAFGMGVDKKDVGMVIHYDISDSLENYVQEAGRAGRDPMSQAKCYVLYSDGDLDKHFILLNQTKLSISEIQQVWKAIKDNTKQRKQLCCSALEIARWAGWDDSVNDIETRVRTAIAALEDAGYVTRGNNVPHVYATGIMVKNMDEARMRLTRSSLFSEKEREDAVRIIKSLISSRNIQRDSNDAESRVDYLADILGIKKESVINAINLMRQDGLLADTFDMSAYIEKNSSANKVNANFELYAKLERFIINAIDSGEQEMSLKSLNEKALAQGITSSNVKRIRTLLYFLSVKSLIKKKENAETNTVAIVLCQDKEKIVAKHEKRLNICRFIIKYLYDSLATSDTKDDTLNDNLILVQFSLISILNKYNSNQNGEMFFEMADIHDVEDALLYLSKIGVLKLEGGFLVLYNAMEINRLVDSKYQYKIVDYRLLDEFYKQKIRQIHIVGEYANLMVRDYQSALQYVQDYFQLDFKRFITKYFKGERAVEIEKNITPEKYHKLFDELSSKQRKIIDDNESKYIVVAAGPGSGKTRVLVHKLASLLLLEDVKHEQLLMLTFSRAAATEFKKRLIGLIGNAAYFVEIKTFHSYCFDLIGKVGTLDDAHDVVARATEMIKNGEVEQGRINKMVLVIDEAQDMDEDEFALVRALMQNNDEMRVIAVGDDDQNIFQFRGSDSKHLLSLMTDYQAQKYEMTENYRSQHSIVSFANSFVERIGNRLKTNPIYPVSDEDGIVSITEYASCNMELPLINQLCANANNQNACILTNTNEEALQIVGLLTRRGIKAKLIQSIDGFRFSDLAEVRYFVKIIDKQQQTPVINEELWNSAKQQTLKEYADSSCLDSIKTFFTDFESTNRTKYYSDLKDFVYESEIEDFSTTKDGTICVSTIHKAKGREFDTVYMLLKNERAESDEAIRKLYVGITRAKSRLFIHCNSDLFKPEAQKNKCIYLNDNNVYPEPDEITIQLTHKDVYLDFFKGKKSEILKLRSGQPLTFYNNYLLANDDRVALLSAKKRDELNALYAKGYRVKSGTIRFIVAWKGKEDTEENAVVLANLTLQRLANS
ncbi:MAG: RecQ family ATP-dependent DNA helicase [Salinivirgaceae bacterium]|nr:RecQ family ATP-dependent DNA helicase [Salinivirgaceae bacterium]